jgi:hypothetical protein
VARKGKPAPIRRPPVAPGRALTLTAHAAYRGQSYAREIPWANGVHVGATVRHRSGYCAALGASAFVSEIRAEGFGTFGVTRVPVELLGAGYCPIRGRAHLRALVGVTLEPTLRTQAQALAGATSNPPSSFVAWAASGTLAGDWIVTGPLSITLGVGLDAFLADQTFVAEGAPGSLLSPHTFRVRTEFGLAVQAF